MKKIVKKLYLILCAMLMVLLFGKNDVYAFEYIETNSIRGFDVVNLTKISEDEGAKTINGSTYYYGESEMWTALYTFYDEVTNSKYYFVLVEATLTSRDDDAYYGYYRMVNKEMDINIKHFVFEGFSRIKYSPEQAGETIISQSITASIGSSGGYNGGYNGTITAGVSSSETITVSEIILTPYKYKDYVRFKFVFQNLTNSKNYNYPWRGSVIRRMVSVYKLSNFNEAREELVDFSITYKGSILRVANTLFGPMKETTVSCSIEHKYSL